MSMYDDPSMHDVPREAINDADGNPNADHRVDAGDLRRYPAAGTLPLGDIKSALVMFVTWAERHTDTFDPVMITLAREHGQRYMAPDHVNDIVEAFIEEHGFKHVPLVWTGGTSGEITPEEPTPCPMPNCSVEGLNDPIDMEMHMREHNNGWEDTRGG